MALPNISTNKKIHCVTIVVYLAIHFSYAISMYYYLNLNLLIWEIFISVRHLTATSILLFQVQLTIVKSLLEIINSLILILLLCIQIL